MEQRRLRLGDILDDYCPRERRVTNHAVVAMIEEDVKQTRCTTCDAEHAYKAARVPSRKKKDSPAALYEEVLAGLTDGQEAPTLAAPSPAAPAPLPPVLAAPPLPTDHAVNRPLTSAASGDDREQPEPEPEPEFSSEYESGPTPSDEAPAEGPVHRRLIRATLPRIEGQKEARPVPDFTVRHASPRGNGQGGFTANRGDRDRGRPRSGHAGNGNGNGNSHAYGASNGNRPHGGPRFQGNRSSGQGRPPTGRAGASSGFRGQGSGNGNSFGNGNGNGHGNKRGRGPRG